MISLNTAGNIASLTTRPAAQSNEPDAVLSPQPTASSVPAAAYSPSAQAHTVAPAYSPPIVSSSAAPDTQWASSSLLEAASGRIIATVASGQPVILTVLGASAPPTELPVRPSASPPPGQPVAGGQPSIGDVGGRYSALR